MSKRTWCPSLGPQRDDVSSVIADVDFQADSKSYDVGTKTSARRDAAVAANSGASAKAICGTLSQMFQRRFQKFDAAVVSSNANRQLWPRSPELSALQFHSPLVPVGAAVCLNVRELEKTPIRVPQVAVPTDSINDVVSFLLRHDKTLASSAPANECTGLIGLPSVNHVASMSDVFSCLMISQEFLKHIRRLTVCDASAGDETSGLRAFSASAVNLEALSLVNCSLRADMSMLMEVLKDREVHQLCLERSAIGCGSTDAERDAVLSSMAAYLKSNKFLTSLDLSYTDLDPEAVSTLMSALVDSNTQMLPHDVNDEAPDTFDPASLIDRLNPAVLMGTARRDNTEYSEGGGAEHEELAADIDEEEERGASQDGSGDASLENGFTGDGDADDDPDEEGEDGEDGERASRHNPSAEENQKQRDRERLRAEHQLQKQHRHQVEEHAQLEARERRTLIEEYLSGVNEIVASSSADIAKRYAEEKQRAKEVYCSRRSGWSHLQALLLRGNRLGDSGVKQVALLLRDEVPLSEDEARERQEAADAARSTIGAALGAGRAAIAAKERKAWKRLLQMAQSEFAAFSVHQDDGALAKNAEEEEDEYAKEAPSVLLTNVENRRGGGSDDDDDGVAPSDDGGGKMTAEEKSHWEEWAAAGLPLVTVAPMKKGMRSITLLDLGSCHIGRKGLEALAQVLRTNTVLETLCLRHNPIGGGTVKSTTTSHEGPAGTLSTSFASFADMLHVNKSLRTLDVGYCQLGPDHVRALAAAIRDNPVLETVGLEGNQLGIDEAYQQKQLPHSYLYDLWMAAAQPGSALRHLHMSHNSVALCLWPEEAAALAAVCGQLSSFSFSHVGLQESHVQLWSEALQQNFSSHHPTVSILELSRNDLAGEAGGKALGSLLHCFTSLKELVLNDYPLLGSAGVAAALEHLPTTMRSLSCDGTGLTEPLVGAVQSPVLPPPVAEQLTSLMLGDVEAPNARALEAWTTHLAESAKHVHSLSLWARGMAGKEGEVLPLFVGLARACPFLQYVDCGFRPQFRASTPIGAQFAELERILLQRRLS
jgi:hypothetical protein